MLVSRRWEGIEKEGQGKDKRRTFSTKQKRIRREPEPPPPTNPTRNQQSTTEQTHDAVDRGYKRKRNEMEPQEIQLAIVAFQKWSMRQNEE